MTQEVQRLSYALTMLEDEVANQYFSARHLARADIKLSTDQILKSDWFEPQKDANKPPNKLNWRINFTLILYPLWVMTVRMPSIKL